MFDLWRGSHGAFETRCSPQTSSDNQGPQQAWWLARLAGIGCVVKRIGENGLNFSNKLSNCWMCAVPLSGFFFHFGLVQGSRLLKGLRVTESSRALQLTNGEKTNRKPHCKMLRSEITNYVFWSRLCWSTEDFKSTVCFAEGLSQMFSEAGGFAYEAMANTTASAAAQAAGALQPIARGEGWRSKLPIGLGRIFTEFSIGPTIFNFPPFSLNWLNLRPTLLDFSRNFPWLFSIKPSQTRCDRLLVSAWLHATFRTPPRADPSMSCCWTSRRRGSSPTSWSSRIASRSGRRVKSNTLGFKKVLTLQG